MHRQVAGKCRGRRDSAPLSRPFAAVRRRAGREPRPCAGPGRPRSESTRSSARAQVEGGGEPGVNCRRASLKRGRAEATSPKEPRLAEARSRRSNGFRVRATLSRARASRGVDEPMEAGAGEGKSFEFANCCGVARGGATMSAADAGVTQLVECQPSKLNVEGSSPFARFADSDLQPAGFARLAFTHRFTESKRRANGGHPIFSMMLAATAAGLAGVPDGVGEMTELAGGRCDLRVQLGAGVPQRAGGGGVRPCRSRST